MDIVVPVRLVPDPVEELDPGPEGTDIDRDWIEFVSNEWADQALEEALLATEERDTDDTVTVVALDDGLGDVEEVLHRAAAKGADRLVKITNVEPGASTSAATALLAGFLEDEEFDAVFTGVQSAEDRDGQLAGQLASALELPHITVITSVDVDGDSAAVEKEFGGGVTADYTVDFPAVLGIQAAREPPRYVTIRQIRDAMRSADIESVDAGALDGGAEAGTSIVGLHEPETGERAEMIDGSAEEAADEVIEVLEDHGIRV
jgi:electron transfer flavoprotein beta subunit